MLKSILKRPLKNVKSQTFEEYEHVVFDGFSKDKTVSIIQQHSHSRLKFIQEKDSGIYDAMNKAIAHAKGEWVYFLNAGDLFYDDEVLSQIFNHKLYKKADLLSGKVKTMNDPSGSNT